MNVKSGFSSLSLVPCMSESAGRDICDVADSNLTNFHIFYALMSISMFAHKKGYFLSFCEEKKRKFEFLRDYFHNFIFHKLSDSRNYVWVLSAASTQKRFWISNFYYDFAKRKVSAENLNCRWIQWRHVASSLISKLPKRST